MSVPLHFRRATAADVAAVVALVESAYRGQASRVGWTTEADLLDGRRTDADAVTAIVAAPQGCLLLAEATDGLVACCRLERVRDDVTYFGMFAVRPTLQAQGIGRRLLARAEDVASTRWQAHTMEMTVIAQRTDLIEWYARRGYLPTGQTRPFPYGDPRFGKPRRPDLYFVVLAKALP